MGGFHLLGSPQKIDQKSTENVDPEIGNFGTKSWFWRPPVVTNGFASKNCAFWDSQCIRGSHGDPFRANFCPQHVWHDSGGKFFDPTPRSSRETPHESCVGDASWMIMHHPWSWVMHQWWSWITVNHQWSCIIMHHGSWSIMDHHASCMIIHHHQPGGLPRWPGGWSGSKDKRETPIWASHEPIWEPNRPIPVCAKKKTLLLKKVGKSNRKKLWIFCVVVFLLGNFGPSRKPGGRAAGALNEPKWVEAGSSLIGKNRW